MGKRHDFDMEEDEISAQACKFPRLENGRSNPNNNKILGSTEENGEMVVRRGGGVVGVGGGEVVSSNRFHGWHHHSSRIIRVSRASGGKDRHSKVMTSKGLRDRRVRLSVTTAIQFYDLQDRLGYDQPSKAVEWLIKAASDAISELPSLSNTFPDTPKDHQPSDEKRVGSVEGTEHHHHQGFGDTNNNADEDYQNQTQSQNLSLSKSACSSNSETSKGSGGLSLSRSEIRVKARERARERAAKDKEKDNTTGGTTTTHQHNPISQTASFTELLTGGINTSSTTGDDEHGHHHETNLFNKAARQQWCTTTAMDYFNSGLIVGNHSMRTHNNHNNQASSGFSSGQIQLGNSCFPLQAALSVSPFNVVVGGENHQSSDHQLQNFSSMPDHSHHQHHQHHHHLMASGSSDYNLNFTISPSSSSAGLAGFNRGTLQSNSSPSLLPTHPLHQRFSSSSLDGSNLPFFIGAAPPTTMENHHHHHQQQQQQQFSSGFDGRLQLCYGDLTRHSDHNKGKGGKN